MPELEHIRDKTQRQRYPQAQYGRRWKVHFAKKIRGAWRSVKYLGRYLSTRLCQRRNSGSTAAVP
uniref:transposase n=1 Tax=Klebsiella pneumoniae TaxID=573 RepID=UPI0015E837C2